MAIVKIFVDKRKLRKDNTLPVKLSIYKDGKTAYVPLNVFANEKGEIFKQFQSLVNERQASAKRLVIEMMSDGSYDSKSASDIANCIKTYFNAPEIRPKTFKEYFEEVGNLHKDSTKGLYMATLRKIEEFERVYAGDVVIEEVDVLWLKRFEAFLTTTMPSANSRSIHLRNIRAVFNFANEAGFTDKYPFKAFRIKHEETEGHPLSLDELITFITFPLTAEWQIECRDMFMLSFWLGGINPVDLLNLKSLDKGRCVYRRRKTGKMYNIPVCQEALELIEKYKGNGYLINGLNRYTEYKDYLRHIDRNLKTIGQTIKPGCKHEGEALFPNLTYYDARRSLATIAYEIGIAEETISEILGHSFGLPVTNLYIRKNGAKIDDGMNAVFEKIRGRLHS